MRRGRRPREASRRRLEKGAAPSCDASAARRGVRVYWKILCEALTGKDESPQLLRQHKRAWFRENFSSEAIRV